MMCEAVELTIEHYQRPDVKKHSVEIRSQDGIGSAQNQANCGGQKQAECDFQVRGSRETGSDREKADLEVRIWRLYCHWMNDRIRDIEALGSGSDRRPDSLSRHIAWQECGNNIRTNLTLAEWRLEAQRIDKEWRNRFKRPRCQRCQKLMKAASGRVNRTKQDNDLPERFKLTITFQLKTLLEDI